MCAQQGADGVGDAEGGRGDELCDDELRVAHWLAAVDVFVPDERYFPFWRPKHAVLPCGHVVIVDAHHAEESEQLVRPEERRCHLQLISSASQLLRSSLAANSQLIISHLAASWYGRAVPSPAAHSQRISSYFAAH